MVDPELSSATVRWDAIPEHRTTNLSAEVATWPEATGNPFHDMLLVVHYDDMLMSALGGHIEIHQIYPDDGGQVDLFVANFPAAAGLFAQVEEALASISRADVAARAKAQLKGTP